MLLNPFKTGHCSGLDEAAKLPCMPTHRYSYWTIVTAEKVLEAISSRSIKAFNFPSDTGIDHRGEDLLPTNSSEVQFPWMNTDNQLATRMEIPLELF